jgi:predicted PolB exonuclease-like 3'-5' exonuclease
MTPILAFDIETIPDCAGIRRLYELPADLPDQDVAEIAFQKRRVQTGNDFLPPHLHRIVTIGCVLREGNNLQVFSIGEPERDEPATIQKFFDGIEKYTPQLVSWNGTSFDLPVLNYRTLLCGACATKFWDQGSDDPDFRYNNYVNRYHARHVDLMDVLAMYQPRNSAPLDQVAQLAGLPGKLGIGGPAVWAAYSRGEIKKIRDYCEGDCANTYLLYLRFQRQRGVITEEQHKNEFELFRSTLGATGKPYWQEFLALWKT